MFKRVQAVQSKHRVLSLGFQITEALLISSALLLSSRYVGYPWNPHFAVLALSSVIFYFFSAHINGLYSSRRGATAAGESLTLLKSWLICFLMVLLISYALNLTGTYFRQVMILWFSFSSVSLLLFRASIRIVLHIIRKKGFNKRYVVIVGAGNLGLRVLQHIYEAAWTGIEVVGFFDDKKTSVDSSTNIPILGVIDDLYAYLKDHKIDYVYIALPMRAENKIKKILYECRTFGAQLFVIPDLFMFELFNSKAEIVGDILMINFNPHIQWKRIFDIVFSLFAILATLPVTLMIAILIKLEDKGPILYGHKRIAAAGKEFGCLKFRTMYLNADKKLKEILENDPQAREEWDKCFKLKNDPRVTKIGKFLRKASLDELPQFLNVLRGEMSIVGARPIVEKELYDYYKEYGGLYCSMKPGITGPWQVGKRNDTEDYDERVQLDAWYARNYSLWLDIKIIVKTVTSMVHGKGAY